MVPMFSWDLVICYLALARTGTYERAAQVVGADQTTIRRRIAQLEQEVGLTLFVRRGNILQPSPGSVHLHDAALDMERAALRFQHASDASLSRGSLRFTTLDILADLLAPGFVGFQRANPQVLLNITTEPHFLDLDQDRVDVALRLARPRVGENGLKKVASIRFGLYGSHAYLERFAALPTAPHDLVALCAFFIHGDHDFELADEQWHRTQDRLGDVLLRADSYTLLQRLCEEGAGLSMLPCFMAQRSPRLVRLGQDYASDMLVDLWIVIRRDMSSSPKVRLLVDFVSEEMRRLRPLLDGPQAHRAPADEAVAALH